MTNGLTMGIFLSRYVTQLNKASLILMVYLLEIYVELRNCLQNKYII